MKERQPYPQCEHCGLAYRSLRDHTCPPRPPSSPVPPHAAGEEEAISPTWSVIHCLKCWPEFYDAIERGEKTFEYRLNDRDYKVGDWLCLHRYDPDTKAGVIYTGHHLMRRVTYMLDRTSTTIPLVEGYCILGLSPAASQAAPNAARHLAAIEPLFDAVADRVTELEQELTVQKEKTWKEFQDRLGLKAQYALLEKDRDRWKRRCELV